MKEIACGGFFMRISKSIDFPKILLYLLLSLFAFFLAQVGDFHEPFSLALCFGMASANLSPILCAIIYFISTLPPSLELFFLSLGQSFLLFLGFFLQKKYIKTEFLKTGILPLFALSINLGLFFAFSPFEGYLLPLEGIELPPLLQKGLLSALLFLLSAVFSVSMKALVHKLFQCRLRDDEIIFTLLSLVIIGVGACRFLSVNAYMGIAFFILLVYAFLVKDATTLICAFTLSLPPLLVAGISPDRFFLYGIAVTLFIRSGRISAVCALLVVFFSFGYLDGLYAYPTDLLVLSLLSALLPCLLFLLFPTPLLGALEKKLVYYREKHLSRIAINRNRASIGEKLFEISAVFREIQTTLTALSEQNGADSVKTMITNLVHEEVCANCIDRENCENKGGRVALTKLIEIGMMKGKANLIDVPNDLCSLCNNQSGLLYAINRQLVDYRKYQVDSENITEGRALLAGQAQGISEILKNLALEQSEPLRMYKDKEKALTLALLRAGVVCSEVLVYGEEEDLTLSLITFGKADVKKLAVVSSHLLRQEMMISERLALAQNKYCCILRKKPFFDAAFGVSSRKKEGETASGDTHSVIKIDESRFMVALSDGMGSGEYAHRISETTISLLESFYRAKMPSSLILSTVNKLLTFNREESFACVDIAVIDLNSGMADIVKIGAPTAFILSGNTVKVLENSSLPLGVLDCIHPDAGEYELTENDVLLFISDGISDAFGSTADLYETLRPIPLKNPQQLTDSLLERALASTQGKARDDMTAIAVRLFKTISSDYATPIKN